MEDKKVLRQHVRLLKSSFTQEELEQKSNDVIAALEKDEWFKTAKVVCLYNSLPDEVNTKELLAKYKGKKKLLLPSIKNSVIELHEYGMNDDTAIGEYGISESCGEVFTDYSQIDLAVVPGMAFDLSGNRLGRGKGYYDRFLPAITAPKIGLCFDFQLLGEIPSMPHDIKMDKVLSD